MEVLRWEIISHYPEHLSTFHIFSLQILYVILCFCVQYMLGVPTLLVFFYKKNVMLHVFF